MTYADTASTDYHDGWPFYLPGVTPARSAPLAARPATDLRRAAARHAGRPPLVAPSGTCPDPHRGGAPCAGGSGRADYPGVRVWGSTRPSG